MKHRIRRREFLAKVAVTTVGGICFPRVLFADTGSEATVLVVHGSKVNLMLAAGIEKMGGWEAFVRAGKQVVVKPNVAWACTPEEGREYKSAVGRIVRNCMCRGRRI